MNPGRTRASVVFSALLMIFAVLFSSLPASSAKAADASPSPVPIGQLIIKGTMKNNDKPVEGVKFKITGEGGFNGEATSIADGTWQIEVKTKGIYKVEILVDSLPKGVGLREPDKNVREVNLNITTTAAVLFPLGKDTRVVQPFGEQVLIRLFAGINLGLLLALAAIGISLIFGTTGLSNFAHGEMLTFGALMTWLLHVQLGLNLLLAIVLTVGLSAGFGWLQDAGLWKPLRKRRLGLNQMMIVSIGFSIVLRYVLLIIFGGDTLVLTSDFAPVQLGPINTTVTSLISMAISLVALAAVAYFLTRTRIGKAARAVSDNAALAASTGIDVERIIRIIWVVAGALSGLAGILYALQFQANWLMGFAILLLLFAAVTLGGLGTALGAAVGSMIIGLVVEMSALVLPTDLKYAAALIILILVLLVRPQGVLGKKQRIG